MLIMLASRVLCLEACLWTKRNTSCRRPLSPPSKQVAAGSKFHLCHWRCLKSWRIWGCDKPNHETTKANDERHLGKGSDQTHRDTFKELQIFQNGCICQNRVYAASPNFCLGWSPFTKASTFPGCSEVSSFWLKAIWINLTIFDNIRVL